MGLRPEGFAASVFFSVRVYLDSSIFSFNCYFFSSAAAPPPILEGPFNPPPGGFRPLAPLPILDPPPMPDFLPSSAEV